VQARSGLLFLALLAAPAPEGWLPDLESGMKAAEKSGRPILVVTAWANDQCDDCKAWRDRVQKDVGFREAAARFERVEWLYGSLSGKVIPWTRRNGGTSDNPTLQVFVADPEGKVIARAPDADALEAKPLVEFLRVQFDAWERTHVGSKIPFEPAEVEGTGEGAARTVACRALDDARTEKRPAAVYVWRKGTDDGDAKAKAEVAACRKFARESLRGADAVKAAEGWTLLFLDLSEPDQALLAKSLGAEAAPQVILLVPGEEKPLLLDRAISGGGLAHHFRKHAPAKGR
jgi:hypothetical protein